MVVVEYILGVSFSPYLRCLLRRGSEALWSQFVISVYEMQLLLRIEYLCLNLSSEAKL